MAFTLASPIRGGGAQIEGDLAGAFSATITAYDGGLALGSYTIACAINMANPLLPCPNRGLEDGTAPFVGILSDTDDITELVFSEVHLAGSANEFAIDSLVVNSTPVTPMPEPNRICLAGMALLGLVATLRYRKRALAS